MNRWFYNNGGVQAGPISKEEILSLLETRKIGADTLVWTEGMADWKRASDLSEFQPSPYAPPVIEETEQSDLSGHVPSGPQIRPWVRYWARTFDFLLFALTFGMVGIFIYPELEQTNDTLLGIALLTGYNFVEPAMLAIFGSTPFKSLLRVRVRNRDGSRLGYFQALRRTFSVWIQGQGLGIPLIALITSITSYTRLTNHGITTWDQSGDFVVSHQNVAWWRWFLLIALFVGFVKLMMIGSTT